MDRKRWKKLTEVVVGQSYLRIDPAVKKALTKAGAYVYSCRHSDDGDWCVPVTIEDHVLVNHALDLVLLAPLNLGKDGFVDLTEAQGLAVLDWPDLSALSRIGRKEGLARI